MKKLRGAKCMTAVTGFVLGAAFLFTACGDDITEVTEVNKNAGVAVLAAGEKISSVACDTANAGEVMFAVDSSAMFMCDGKRWTSINGRDGKNGNKGDDGKSCSIKQNADKSLTITCETEKGQVSYDVKGGSNGMDAVSDDGAICKVSKKSGVAKTDKYDSSSFCYGDNPLNCDKYGRLYLWCAAMDSIGAVERNGGDVSGENVCGYNKKCNTKGKVQGICPEGFHLPDTTEWLSLLRPLAESFRNDEYIGAANKLRELSWKTSQGGNDGAQANYYGFSALPGGYLRSYSYTQSIVDGVGADNVAAFWSSTQKDEDEVYGVLVRDVDQVFLGASGKAFIAYSVRCVGD